MQYALQFGKAVLAATERMLTTLEPGGIRGAKRCVNRNGAVTFTPTVCSHSISVISVNGLTTATPALFTSKLSGAAPTASIRFETPDLVARSWDSLTTAPARDCTKLQTSASATLSRPCRRSSTSGAVS